MGSGRGSEGSKWQIKINDNRRMASNEMGLLLCSLSYGREDNEWGLVQWETRPVSRNLRAPIRDGRCKNRHAVCRADKSREA